MHKAYQLFFDQFTPIKAEIAQLHFYIASQYKYLSFNCGLQLFVGLFDLLRQKWK
jgi:hypothetical protein